MVLNLFPPGCSFPQCFTKYGVLLGYYGNIIDYTFKLHSLHSIDFFLLPKEMLSCLSEMVGIEFAID